MLNEERTQSTCRWHIIQMSVCDLMRYKRTYHETISVKRMNPVKPCKSGSQVRLKSRDHRVHGGGVGPGRGDDEGTGWNRAKAPLQAQQEHRAGNEHPGKLSTTLRHRRGRVGVGWPQAACAAMPVSGALRRLRLRVVRTERTGMG